MKVAPRVVPYLSSRGVDRLDLAEVLLLRVAKNSPSTALARLAESAIRCAPAFEKRSSYCSHRHHHDQTLRGDLREALDDVVADVTASRSEGASFSNGSRCFVLLVEVVRSRRRTLRVDLVELDRRGVRVVPLRWRRSRRRPDSRGVDPRAPWDPLQISARRRRLAGLLLHVFDGVHLDCHLIMLVVSPRDLDLELIIKVATGHRVFSSTLKGSVTSCTKWEDDALRRQPRLLDAVGPDLPVDVVDHLLEVRDNEVALPDVAGEQEEGEEDALASTGSELLPGLVGGGRTVDDHAPEWEERAVPLLAETIVPGRGFSRSARNNVPRMHVALGRVRPPEVAQSTLREESPRSSAEEPHLTLDQRVAGRPPRSRGQVKHVLVLRRAHQFLRVVGGHERPVRVRPTELAQHHDGRVGGLVGDSEVAEERGAQVLQEQPVPLVLDAEAELTDDVMISQEGVSPVGRRPLQLRALSSCVFGFHFCL